MEVSILGVRTAPFTQPTAFPPEAMLPTLGPSLANALIASLVFLYLWRRDGERYLAIWAAAWLLWVARYAYGLASATVVLAPAGVVLPLLALARAGLILWGTHELLRTRVHPAWLTILAVDFVLITLELATGVPVPIPGPPGTVHYLVFAAALTWSGLLFTRTRDLPRFETRVTGFALMVFGVLQVTFPMLTSFPEWYTQTVYVVVYFLQALIPIGVLLAYLRRSATEVGNLHDALSGALTRALAEHLPICSHCNAIREEEDWVRLEQYVSVRTEATFSHGICPTCFDEHYPDFSDDDAPVPAV